MLHTDTLREFLNVFLPLTLRGSIDAFIEDEHVDAAGLIQFIGRENKKKPDQLSQEAAEVLETYFLMDVSKKVEVFLNSIEESEVEEFAKSLEKVGFSIYKKYKYNFGFNPKNISDESLKQKITAVFKRTLQEREYENLLVKLQALELKISDITEQQGSRFKTLEDILNSYNQVRQQLISCKSEAEDLIFRLNKYTKFWNAEKLHKIIVQREDSNLWKDYPKIRIFMRDTYSQCVDADHSAIDISNKLASLSKSIPDYIQKLADTVKSFCKNTRDFQAEIQSLWDEFNIDKIGSNSEKLSAAQSAYNNLLVNIKDKIVEIQKILPANPLLQSYYDELNVQNRLLEKILSSIKDDQESLASKTKQPEFSELPEAIAEVRKEEDERTEVKLEPVITSDEETEFGELDYPKEYYEQLQPDSNAEEPWDYSTPFSPDKSLDTLSDMQDLSLYESEKPESESAVLDSPLSSAAESISMSGIVEEKSAEEIDAITRKYQEIEEADKKKRFANYFAAGKEVLNAMADYYTSSLKLFGGEKIKNLNIIADAFDIHGLMVSVLQDSSTEINHLAEVIVSKSLREAKGEVTYDALLSTCNSELLPLIKDIIIRAEPEKRNGANLFLSSITARTLMDHSILASVLKNIETFNETEKRLSSLLEVYDITKDSSIAKIIIEAKLIVENFHKLLSSLDPGKQKKLESDLQYLKDKGKLAILKNLNKPLLQSLGEYLNRKYKEAAQTKDPLEEAKALAARAENFKLGVNARIELLFAAVKKCLEADTGMYVLAVNTADSYLQKIRNLINPADSLLQSQYLALAADVYMYRAKGTSSNIEAEQMFFNASVFYYDALLHGNKVVFDTVNQKPENYDAYLARCNQQAMACYKLSDVKDKVSETSDQARIEKLIATIFQNAKKVQDLAGEFQAIKNDAKDYLQGLQDELSKEYKEEFKGLAVALENLNKRITDAVIIQGLDSLADLNELYDSIRAFYAENFLTVINEVNSLLKRSDEATIKPYLGELQSFKDWFKKNVWIKCDLLFPEEQRSISKEQVGATTVEQVEQLYVPPKALPMESLVAAYERMHTFVDDNKEYKDEIESFGKLIIRPTSSEENKRSKFTEVSELLQFDFDYKNNDLINFLYDTFNFFCMSLEDIEDLKKHVAIVARKEGTLDSDDTVKLVRKGIAAANRMLANFDAIVSDDPGVTTQLRVYKDEISAITKKYADIVHTKIPKNIEQYLAGSESVLGELVKADVKPAVEVVVPPDTEKLAAEQRVEESQSQDEALKSLYSMDWEELSKTNYLEEESPTLSSVIENKAEAIQPEVAVANKVEEPKSQDEMLDWDALSKMNYPEEELRSLSPLEAEKPLESVQEPIETKIKEVPKAPEPVIENAEQKEAEVQPDWYSDEQLREVNYPVEDLEQPFVPSSEPAEVKATNKVEGSESQDKTLENLYSTTWEALGKMNYPEEELSSLSSSPSSVEPTKSELEQPLLEVSEPSVEEPAVQPESEKPVAPEFKVAAASSIPVASIAESELAAEPVKVPPVSVSEVVKESELTIEPVKAPAAPVSELKPTAKAELPPTVAAVPKPVKEISEATIIAKAKSALKALTHYYNTGHKKVSDINKFGALAFAVTQFISSKSLKYGEANASDLTEEVQKLLQDNCRREIDSLGKTLSKIIKWRQKNSVPSDLTADELYYFEVDTNILPDSIDFLNLGESSGTVRWMLDVPLTTNDINWMKKELIDEFKGLDQDDFMEVQKLFSTEKYAGKSLWDASQKLLDEFDLISGGLHNKVVVENKIIGSFMSLTRQRLAFVTAFTMAMNDSIRTEKKAEKLKTKKFRLPELKSLLSPLISKKTKILASVPPVAAVPEKAAEVSAVLVPPITVVKPVEPVVVTASTSEKQQSPLQKVLRATAMVAAATASAVVMIATPFVAIAAALVAGAGAGAVTAVSDKIEQKRTESKSTSKIISELKSAIPAQESKPETKVTAEVTKPVEASPELPKPDSAPTMFKPGNYANSVKVIHDGTKEVKVSQELHPTYKQLFVLKGNASMIDHAIREIAKEEGITIETSNEGNSRIYTLFKDSKRLDAEQKSEFVVKALLFLDTHEGCNIAFNPNMKTVEDMFDIEKSKLEHEIHQRPTLAMK